MDARPDNERSKTMTVGDLRRALEGVPDHLEVAMRVKTDDEEGQAMAGLVTARVEQGCADQPGFMLDGEYDATSSYEDDLDIAPALRPSVTSFVAGPEDIDAGGNTGNT